MTQPLFDKDVETLLAEKISYHKEQAKIHLKLAKETQEKLNILSASSENNSTNKIQESLLDAAERLSNSSSTVLLSELIIPTDIDLNFSVTVWRPRVERVLKAHDRPLNTRDIMMLIDMRYAHDEKIAKQAIGAISSSLFYLVEKNLVTKMEFEGRGYLYKWNR